MRKCLCGRADRKSLHGLSGTKNVPCSKKAYEDELNQLVPIDEAMYKGAYMRKAKRLLSRGKYGTALRKYDPIGFNTSYQYDFLDQCRTQQKEQRKWRRRS